MKDIQAIEARTKSGVINYQPQYEDTIDLLAIFSFFYQWRRVILGISLLGTLLAALLAYTIPPKYKTVTQLTPPKLFQYNALASNLDLNIAPERLFNQFTEQLLSRSNLFNFVLQSNAFKQTLLKKQKLSEEEKIQLANQLAAQYKIIPNIITTNKTTPNKNVSSVISTNWIDVETISPKIDLKASDNLAYIQYTNQRVMSILRNEQKVIAKQAIKQLEEKIQMGVQQEKINRINQTLRLKNEQEFALKQLNHRLAQLQKKDAEQKKIMLTELSEAYELARVTQKVKDKTDEPVMLAEAKDKKAQQLIDINFNPQQTDLYLKGTLYLKKALELAQKRPHTTAYEQELLTINHEFNTIKNNPEISLISKRKNDQAYLKDIAQDLTRLDHLKHLSFDTTGVRAYNQEGDSEVGVTPYSPNKKGIILIGVLLSFMLGLLASAALGIRRQLHARTLSS